MHHCTYFCQDGQHVIRALTPEEETAAQVCQRLQATTDAVEILEARPAREADVARWQEEITHYVVDGTTRSRQVPRSRHLPPHVPCTQAWLVFFRYVSEGGA